MLYMSTGKPAHLGCKFLLHVSVINSPIVVEMLVITVLFCVVMPPEFLLYMFRVIISPIIRSTYAVYGHR